MINKKLFDMTIKEKEKNTKSWKDNDIKKFKFYFIKITEQDDKIEVQHSFEDNKYKILFFHNFCAGNILFENLKKYNILCCEKCNLRIEFPIYINEIKELKEYFENKFKIKKKKITRAQLIDLED